VGVHWIKSACERRLLGEFGVSGKRVLSLGDSMSNLLLVGRGRRIVLGGGPYVESPRE